MGLVEKILTDLDKSVMHVGQKYFTSTADALDPMLSILTAILLALIGIGMALGAYNISKRDAWQLVTRIVLIFLFARSWHNFGLIYEALSEASRNLAMGFFTGAFASPDAAMDRLAVQMSDTVDGAARATSSIMRGLVSAGLYIILAVLMAAYVLIVGFAKIMIAFLLGIAPLAMIATMFDKTKNLFEAWLSSFVGYLLYPVAAAAVIGAVVSMANAQFNPQDKIENLSMLLGFLCVVFVGIFALMAIPTAASNITGSFNLAGFAPEALRTIGSPATGAAAAARRYISPRAQALASGAMTGKTPGLAERAREREWAERGSRFAQKLRGIEIMQGKHK